MSRMLQSEHTRCCKFCRDKLQSLMPFEHMPFCCCVGYQRQQPLETLAFRDNGIFCHLDIAIAGAVLLATVKFLLFIS